MRPLECVRRSREVVMSSESELHRVILENIAEGICLVRAADHAIVYANPRFEQMFGYDAGELTGRDVAILNDPDDETSGEEVARRILDELDRRGDATYEVRNRRKDGTPFWCRARTSAFAHPEYGPVWVAVQADITAEKQAAERLRRHEQLLRVVFEALPVGLWITDRDGRIVSGNAAGQRIWAGARYVGVEHYGEYRGWWPETGKPIAPEEWALARAIQHGETEVGELVKIQCFDDSFKMILNSATPLRDGGEITGAIVVNEDVTRMMEAEALSAGVIAAAPDAIIATNSERRIVVFNTGAERMFGWDHHEAIGRDLAELVADRDALDTLLAAVVAGELIDTHPIMGCRKSGETFPAEVSAACTHGGIHRRCNLVFRDITARVRAEEERAALYRAAQRATKTRDDVLAVVAHDLRGPLSTILFSIEVLAARMSTDDAEAHRSAALIKRAARQLNHLISDLLDAVQLEAGMLRIEKTPLIVADVIAEAVEMAPAAATQHALEVRVPAGLPTVSADHHRILQVLSNLIGNAVKFTPAGGRISVTAERRDHEVLVRVRDTGPGLPAAQLDRIFDRFWKAGPHDRSGAGLGLAIVKGLVEAHGGAIWVESQEGAGAAFTFSLPIAG